MTVCTVRRLVAGREWEVVGFWDLIVGNISLDKLWIIDLNRI